MGCAATKFGGRACQSFAKKPPQTVTDSEVQDNSEQVELGVFAEHSGLPVDREFQTQNMEEGRIELGKRRGIKLLGRRKRSLGKKLVRKGKQTRWKSKLKREQVFLGQRERRAQRKSRRRVVRYREPVPECGPKKIKNCKEEAFGPARNRKDWKFHSHGDNEDLTKDNDIEAMQKGSHMQKLRSSSWMKTRFYKLQEDCQTVWYNSKKILKSARSQMFSIDDIKELKPGHQTEGMQRYATDIPTDRCFSIVFKGTRKNLDLVATDADEARHWIHGISKLVKRNDRMKMRERLIWHLSNGVPRQSARERGCKFPHFLREQPPTPPPPHVEGQRCLPMLEYFAVCFPYLTFSSLRPSASTDSISY